MLKRKLRDDAGEDDEEEPTTSRASSSSNNNNNDSSSSSHSSSSGFGKVGKGRYTNKQRVLIIASRGITARYRHLLEDFKKLLPHHKKDSKLDDKGDIQSVNEIAEMKSCNQILYLETRKHQDLYMHVGKTPHGPSAKFHVVNIHTMDELKLTGNCMIGSRPLLNFDAGFDDKVSVNLSFFIFFFHFLFLFLFLYLYLYLNLYLYLYLLIIL